MRTASTLPHACSASDTAREGRGEVRADRFLVNLIKISDLELESRTKGPTQILLCEHRSQIKVLD